VIVVGLVGSHGHGRAGRTSGRYGPGTTVSDRSGGGDASKRPHGRKPRQNRYWWRMSHQHTRGLTGRVLGAGPAAALPSGEATASATCVTCSEISLIFGLGKG
jgi:hypothetical protein